jgi:integrase
MMLITERCWLELIEAWVRWLRAGDAKPGTIKTRLHYIGRLAAEYRLKRPGDLTTDELTVSILDHWMPETKKSARASICSFYGWLALTGRIPRDPSLGLPKVRVPRAEPRPVPVPAFVAAVRDADARTRLILQLGRFGGMRRGEISRVHPRRDLDEHGWLTIRGKGDHVRRIPLHPVLLRQLGGAPAGWLFPSVAGGHLTPGHIGRLASQALPPGWTLHSCRHRAGTDMYSVERDIRAVQEILGHASVRTTQLYVQVADDALISAVMGIAS